MTHTYSSLRSCRMLLGTGLAVLASLTLTSALWANGAGGPHGGSGGGHGGSGGPHGGSGGPHGGSGGPHGGQHTGGGSGGGKGHVHNGHTYQHNTFSKLGCGWSRKAFCPSQGCYVYWCPAEGCWYTYDAADETFVPCDGWTDENMDGLQYGP